jgi:hypothetical protein
MSPEFACNLLETLPLPPWKKELDWGLYITRRWERRIPFSSYVRPKINAASNGFWGQATSFSQFGLLAAELQLRILSVCSISTLFQLMHVSSTLRAEASKLFWANPSAYFLVDAYWLLDGGYPGYQCSDLAFLQNVQNVEIEYEPSTNNDIWPRLGGEMAIRHDRITTFWNSIKRRFPRIQRVVVNQNGEPGIWRGADAVPPPLQALVQACPLSINISVLVSKRQPLPNADTSTKVQPRQIWQRSNLRFRANHVWTQLEFRHNKTILLPMRQFDGLVGKFEVLKHRCLRIQLQQYGLWPLAIEALDRHQFNNGRNNPFTCPWPECNTYFEKAGQWTVHAAVFHYQQPSHFSVLPDEIRVLLEGRASVLEDSIAQARTQFGRIKEEWDSAGQDERSAIGRVWIEQLEETNIWDAAGQGPSKNKLWKDFLEWANGSSY